jgi:hypothetical protein
MSEEDDKKPSKPRRISMGFMGNEDDYAQERSSKVGADKKETMEEREADLYNAYINEYIQSDIDELPDYWDFSEHERLALKLFRATIRWNFKTFKEMVSDKNVPLDYKLPSSGLLVLHFVAGYGSIRMYEELLQREDELDFLARDWLGRLPSELAAQHLARNNLSQLLMEKELAAKEAARDPRIVEFTPRRTVYEDGTVYPPNAEDYLPSPSNPFD